LAPFSRNGGRRVGDEGKLALLVAVGGRGKDLFEGKNVSAKTIQLVVLNAQQSAKLLLPTCEERKAGQMLNLPLGLMPPITLRLAI